MKLDYEKKKQVVRVYLLRFANATAWDIKDKPVDKLAEDLLNDIGIKKE